MILRIGLDGIYKHPVTTRKQSFCFTAHNPLLYPHKPTSNCLCENYSKIRTFVVFTFLYLFRLHPLISLKKMNNQHTA